MFTAETADSPESLESWGSKRLARKARRYLILDRLDQKVGDAAWRSSKDSDRVAKKAGIVLTSMAADVASYPTFLASGIAEWRFMRGCEKELGAERSKYGILKLGEQVVSAYWVAEMSAGSTSPNNPIQQKNQ